MGRLQNISSRPKTHIDSSLINIANLTNSFLRRDGGNTAIGAIDLNSNIIKNVLDPVSNQDVATKNYVDTHAFTTAGGVVSRDIKLKIWF